MGEVVTMSASYRAHRDQVGRALAGRRHLPFADRAIPAAAAPAWPAPGLVRLHRRQGIRRL